jgi:hypothetical protein
MSFDILISLALFVGALLLMIRFGCGARMGHTDGHGGSNSDQTGGAGQGSFKRANGVHVEERSQRVQQKRPLEWDAANAQILTGTNQLDGGS